MEIKGKVSFSAMEINHLVDGKLGKDLREFRRKKKKGSESMTA